MPRLLTEWSTDDPQLAEMLRSIDAEPEHTSLRQELEGALHMMQARLAWRRADQYREYERQREARFAKQKAKADG